MKRFNVRVYGVWINEDHILVSEEMIHGKAFVKFPGGGLEYGEGTIDCVKREWKEELGLDIEVMGHLYTTDFFQPSAFDDSQVISIYYMVKGKLPVAITNHIDGERTFWLAIKDIQPDTFPLPIDKLVGLQIKALLNSNKI